MKYIFVINPAAGPKGSENKLLEELKNRNDFDFDIYYTKGKNDATAYVKNLCKDNPEIKYCFVACGGDGTICEIVNGIYGFSNACLTVWPVGSGNDYVKYYGGKELFFDIDGLLEGKHFMVDVMKVKDIYSLNVVSFGFDCEVLKTMEKVKRMPIIGGGNSYTTGVIKGLFTGLVNEASVLADGELLNDSGKYLLCTVANGCYVGGGYNCAPRSICDDGLLEVCLVKTMPITRVVPLISKYKKGLHLDDESIADVLEYRQATKVEIISKEEMAISVDGELVYDKHFIIENIPQAIEFIVPRDC